MFLRSVFLISFFGLLSFSTFSHATTATLAHWAFTDQIVNSSPANELQMSSLSNKDIYIFTRWQDLAIEFYEVEAIIYDGENNLVGYSKYGFMPDKETWDSWTRYHFRPDFDEPGEWRFVVKLNGEKALDQVLYVEN
ncbi:MAG: hypothetical protein MI976_12575 [Pseudomonadales bacterium]|nr:hypothetical protein [Pseudomonadales bacterium]